MADNFQDWLLSRALLLHLHQVIPQRYPLGGPWIWRLEATATLGRRAAKRITKNYGWGLLYSMCGGKVKWTTELLKAADLAEDAWNLPTYSKP